MNTFHLSGDPVKFMFQISENTIPETNTMKSDLVISAMIVRDRNNNDDKIIMTSDHNPTSLQKCRKHDEITENDENIHPCPMTSAVFTNFQS